MLIEPILVPVWAYLIDPVREQPDVWMILGGLFVVGSLAYRYWPRGGSDERQPDPPANAP
jgi:hypothetical protein